jgi:DNA polymerase III psi subunit
MWDEVQREILAALGHEPLVLAPLPEDALLQALLRAAGRDAESADLPAVLRALPATATLRGNTAAKRALWPRIRKFRSGR